MARSDTWSLDKQIKKHDVSKQAIAQKGQLATNHFGRPEGLFFYGTDQTSQWECSVDLDLQKMNVGTAEKPKMEVQVVGMQMLCPRCSSPLYIKGKMIPGGREIVVHWDKIMRAEADGLFRPLISVDGPVGCDYYDSEISNIGKASASDVIMRCGWRGGIINGHCFDHFVPSATSETKTFTNDTQDQISKFLTDADIEEWKKKSKEASNEAIAGFQDAVVESSKTESAVLLESSANLGFQVDGTEKPKSDITPNETPIPSVVSVTNSSGETSST